jgi:hypothetical protein
MSYLRRYNCINVPSIIQKIDVHATLAVIVEKT